MGPVGSFPFPLFNYEIITMSNATPSRFGQDLGSGSVDALFRSIYLAEVLTAFHTANVVADKHMVRTITNGKSATFPVSGIAGGGYHTAGTEILGRSIKASEKVIVVDDILFSDTFIAKIDEAKVHYDVRSVYTKEQGEFLAKTWDENVFRMIAQAARAASNVPGEVSGGTVLYDADYLTDASALAAGIFAAVTQLDENGVPAADRFAYLKPAQLALLVQNKDTINKDWGGQGSYASGSIAMIGGAPLVKTTHLPREDLSDNTAITAAGRDPAAILAKYRGDYSDTACLVAQKGAVGTVKLLDLALEMNYDFRRLGTLIVASMALGTDILRPECAVELQATTAPGP